MSHHSIGLVLLLLIPAGAAQAGGMMVYEVGQPGSGLTNAGAAVATGPSVLMNNPAGLSAVPGTQFNVNGQLILGDLRFSRGAGNQFDGNEGGNGLDFMPGSSQFLSHALNERATVGFGVYGTFGLAVNYDDDWTGRYFAQEAAVLGLSLQPTYAYRINDQLSIGFGPQIMYGYFRTEAAIDNGMLGAGSGPDGQLEYRDSDVGVGLKLGMLYEPTERTRFGLAYSSKVMLEFEDRPHVEQVTNPVLNAALGQLALERLGGDMDVQQTKSRSGTTLADSYENSALHVLGGGLTWRYRPGKS